MAAMYECGLACRYTGRNDEAIRWMKQTIGLLPAEGADEAHAYYNYGYGFACTYAGDYITAITVGQSQKRHAARSADRYVGARSRSCLALPLYVVGSFEEAANHARDAADDLRESPHSYYVGFIENNHGLALHAMGDVDGAIEAFGRGSVSAEEQVQPRAAALIDANHAWLLYELGDHENAAARYAASEAAFEPMSENDLALVICLRQANSFSEDNLPEDEIDALWHFVDTQYTNPDLVRKPRVAKRISTVARQIGDPAARDRADRYIHEQEAYFKTALAEASSRGLQ
jgi:tetratricopeptide (TPR) repeat protein